MRITRRKSTASRIGILKLGNEYADQLGKLYEKNPKAVLAAVVVALLAKDLGSMNGLPHAFLLEWEMLHINGIVPQKSPAQ
jgi:hypothetical protein